MSPLSIGKCIWFFFLQNTFVFKSKMYNSQMTPKYDIGRKEFGKKHSHFHLWYTRHSISIQPSQEGKFDPSLDRSWCEFFKIVKDRGPKNPPLRCNLGCLFFPQRSFFQGKSAECSVHLYSSPCIRWYAILFENCLTQRPLNWIGLHIPRTSQN